MSEASPPNKTAILAIVMVSDLIIRRPRTAVCNALPQEA